MKTFNALNVSSKFAICGLPIRVDTYKTCSFHCAYCFSNCRKIMEFEKNLQIANIPQIEKRLHRIFDCDGAKPDNFLDMLIKQRITWHCGGMSDPFQPVESKFHITKQMIDVANKYGVHILFSTKGDTVYGADIRPDLHTFQLSVTNVDNRKDLEPNVPDIEKRVAFYKQLKHAGFKVGIRIQPFIPGISSLEIIKMFEDADNFTIEGLKLVPQNAEHKEEILRITGLKSSDFTQMGLLNLKPEIRIGLYAPIIEYMKKKNIPFSISDNDLRKYSTNKCCCGDALVHKASGFDTTAMINEFGENYSKDDVLGRIADCGVGCCKCSNLFTSNRTEGCKTVEEFYEKRFDRKSSPFSPLYQYREGETNGC